MKKLYFLPVILTQFIIRLVVRVLFFTFCNLKIEGLGNIKNIKTPVIFASNHSSEWDGPLVRSAMPMISDFAPMFYAGMDKEFYRIKNLGLRGRFYGSSLFKLVGAYPVYYGLNNYKKSLRNHIRILGDGGSVTIFPEGRMSRNNGDAEFKPGVVALASIANVKIIPVRIKDVENLTLKELLSRKRNVTVKFGKPFSVNISKLSEDGDLSHEYKKQSEELKRHVFSL